MNIRMIASLGCAIALTGAVSARAAGEADAAREIERQPVQVAVKTHDLDLNSLTGSAAVLQRISHAALEACGAGSFSLPEYRWSVQRSDCYRESMGRAVADLRAPVVKRLYDQGAVYASN